MNNINSQRGENQVQNNSWKTNRQQTAGNKSQVLKNKLTYPIVFWQTSTLCYFSTTKQFIPHPHAVFSLSKTNLTIPDHNLDTTDSPSNIQS